MKFLTPIDKWMVGLFALTSGMVLAEGTLSRDVLLQRVERCRRFEHAQDRRDALDALKARSGLSQDEWATLLFDVATNRNDRFVLNDVGRYASTNHLPRRMRSASPTSSTSTRQR